MRLTTAHTGQYEVIRLWTVSGSGFKFFLSQAPHVAAAENNMIIILKVFTEMDEVYFLALGHVSAIQKQKL